MEKENNFETLWNIRKWKVAVSTLNQLAMDFEWNRDRIIASIKQAKEKWAKYRIWPELEITGYSCEDHFLEQDTMIHSLESLADILASEVSMWILCTIWIPIMHKGVRYNCDAYILDNKILWFRPKKILADDWNYREPRWFTAWTKDMKTENFELPRSLSQISGQKTVPIWDFVISTNDTVIWSEKCEEMFAAQNTAIDMGFDWVEIFWNWSGSHWELAKWQKRIDLIRTSTRKSWWAYLYSNLIWWDWWRLLFDWWSVIAQNWEILNKWPQFSMREVITTTAIVNFTDIRSHRWSIRSYWIQAESAAEYPRIKANINITSNDLLFKQNEKLEQEFLSKAEEISKWPAIWLWDYLRRSWASWFFLPLSGWSDSATTASIVWSMAHMVLDEINNWNEQVLKDVRRIVWEEENSTYVPSSPKEFLKRIFYCSYMATDENWEETKQRASSLAEEIWINHNNVNITVIIEAFKAVISETLNIDPKFESEWWSPQEDLSLQNISARTRMALSYFLAQLFKISKWEKWFLLVLWSSNVDEANRWYFTKYDCSSADINPIWGIWKNDLKDFLTYAADQFWYKTLLDILAAKPTAELRPKDNWKEQSDEEDMGMTYEQLETFAILFQEKKLWPVSMFECLCQKWWPASEKKMSIRDIADMVKKFFKYYAINRHKLTTLTPSVHAVNYSPDDNRFNLRPFLINVKWPFQFKKIDKLVIGYEKLVQAC